MCIQIKFMKKYFILSAVLLSLISSLHTTAQKRNANLFFGGNLVLSNPTGNFSDAYRTGFGIEGMGGVKLTDNLYGLATLGYLSYNNENDNPYGNINVTSLKGGLRYYAGEKFFIAGNAGFGFARDEVEPKSYSRFIGDVGAGAHFGLVQAGLFYEGRKKIFSDGFANSVQLKVGIALR
jgi:hypothetical protein